MSSFSSRILKKKKKPFSFFQTCIFTRACTVEWTTTVIFYIKFYFIFKRWAITTAFMAMNIVPSGKNSLPLALDLYSTFCSYK